MASREGGDGTMRFNNDATGEQTAAGTSEGGDASDLVGGLDIALTPEAQDAINHQLRRLYSGILSEPTPDRFAQLLADLSKVEGGKS
ncbi:MAG: NepR family anti-sigma factor [Hyphomicrobiaceae bacterium]|nr:NepR family anti-sigma factor [Hyphomicrobiaceae bacterium]